MQWRKLTYVPGLISLVALPIILLIWHPEDPVRQVSLRMWIPTDVKPTPGNTEIFTKYHILDSLRNKKIFKLDFEYDPHEIQQELYGQKAKRDIIYQEIERFADARDTCSVLKIALGANNTYADFVGILNQLTIYEIRQYGFVDNTFYIFAKEPYPATYEPLQILECGPVEIEPYEGPSRWQIWKWRINGTITITQYMLKHYPIILTGFIVLILLPAILKMANFRPKQAVP